MSRKKGNVPEETRAAILAAAAEEFATYGYEKSSLRRICAGAGVTTGALYTSFQDKNDLFEHVIGIVTEGIYGALEEHFAKEQDSTGKELLSPGGEEEDVRAVMEILHYYYRNQSVCSILFSHREHPVVNAFFDRVIGLIDRQGEKIAALIRKDFGDKAAENLTPDILHWFSHLQVDMIFYLIEHETEEGQAEMQVRHMVRFLRGGLYFMIRSGKLTEEKNQNR